jgi:hypothetical protein
MTENKKQNILALSSTDAKAFLLKEKSYFTFDLPLYFTFGTLLSSVSQELDGNLLPNCSAGVLASL